jgi:hypothetical protein
VRLARLALIVPLLAFAHLARGSEGAIRVASPQSTADLPPIAAESRDAGFSYGASVTPADRQAIEQAVATARPEAQRLVGIVDGLTTVSIGPAGGAAGTATDMGDRYELQLDLAMVRSMGPRGISRLVLHELGHVVDFALMDEALLDELNAKIPAGWVCEEGHVGACAEKEERFAETFAKWATGDIGVDIYLGYKVPPPSVPLDSWGAPLSGLGA